MINPPTDVTPRNPPWNKVFMWFTTAAGYTRRLNYRIVYFVSKREFQRLLEMMNTSGELYRYTDFMPTGDYDLYYNTNKGEPIVYPRGKSLDVITLDNYEYMWLVHPWDSRNYVIGSISHGWPDWSDLTIFTGGN